MPRQTTFAKTSEITPQWRHVDAEGEVLGRLSTRIATVLIGKHRPDYTPHIDCGDYVVVTNAKKVVLTGRKLDQKMQLRFSGYPGGLRATSYRTILERRPEQLLENAVRRMLPKGRLGRAMIRKLKVYAGNDHPHGSQLAPLD